MATIDLYIDTFNKKLVAGLLDSTTVSLPKFIQGDTPTLKIWLLTPIASAALSTPYAYVPVSGVTIQAAIGTRVGNSTTYYTQQMTWTASTDLSDPHFTASFPMNTAAINTLLGATGVSTAAFFEVKMITSAVPTTIYSEGVTVQAAVIKDGGTTEPALGTPLSAEAATAAFLARTIRGAVTLESEDGTKSVSMYVGTDGTVHFDPLT